MAKDIGSGSGGAQQAGGQAAPELTPTQREIHKRIRNTKKKLARVEELEALRANGTALTAEQLPTLASKPGLLAVLEELARLEPLMKEAVKEEVKQENQAAVAKHEKRLRERLDREQQQREQEWQAERDGLVKAREAAEEAAKREPSKGQMMELLKEPLHKLLQMLYFSELFDTLKNPWLAVSEAQACLGYDQRRPSSKNDQHLTDRDLMDIVYFGRTLLARMDKALSHKAFLDLAVDLALKWLYQPKAEVISSPPAPHHVTVGQLASRLSRVMASDFVEVTPEGAAAAKAAAGSPTPADVNGAPAPVSTPPAPQPGAPPPMHAPAPPPVPGLAAAAMGVASGAIPPKPHALEGGRGGGRKGAGGGRGAGSVGEQPPAPPPLPTHLQHHMLPPQPQPPQPNASSGAAAYVTEPPVAPTANGNVDGAGAGASAPQGRPPSGLAGQQQQQQQKQQPLGTLPHSLSLGDVVVPADVAAAGGHAVVGSAMAGGSRGGMAAEPAGGAAHRRDGGGGALMPFSGPPPPGVVRGIFTPASIMTAEGPQVIPYTSSNLGGLPLHLPPPAHPFPQHHQHPHQHQQPPTGPPHPSAIVSAGPAEPGVQGGSSLYAPQPLPTAAPAGQAPVASPAQPAAATAAAARVLTSQVEPLGLPAAAAAAAGAGAGEGEGARGGRGADGGEGGRSGRSRGGRNRSGSSGGGGGGGSVPGAGNVKYVPANTVRVPPPPQLQQPQQVQPPQQQQQQGGSQGPSSSSSGGGGGRGGRGGRGSRGGGGGSAGGAAAQGQAGQPHQQQGGGGQSRQQQQPHAPPARALQPAATHAGGVANTLGGGTRPQPLAAKKGGGFGPTPHQAVNNGK